ncbi:MAG TPA: ankyrin repeat domain-containing protein, partial [Ktedonobacteraceae bacterium]|nr:ankyrin repeat domain-containing protein [Ktedonobacteraceae bacterium]
EVQHGLDAGVAVDAPYIDGSTALHLASAGNHLLIVAFLLKAGADIEAKNLSQETPLVCAVNEGHLEAVNALLEAGAKPDNAASSPVAIASRLGHKDILLSLLARGADVNACPENAYPAVLWAVVEGHQDILSLLIDAQADLNKYGLGRNTPLAAAISYNHIKMGEMLIEAGADVNLPREDLETPLHLACQKKAPRMVEMLLARGADVTLRTKFKRTPLDEAYLWSDDCVPIFRQFLTWRPYHTLEMIAPQLLTEQPEQFYQQLATFQNDLSFLEWVRTNELEIVHGLLKAGVSANARSGNGTTALIAAVEKNNIPMVELLLAFSADVNAQSEWGTSALMSAAGQGNEMLVEVLLAAGADVHLQSQDYSTALHWAAEKSHFGIMERLYQAGASVNPNLAGWSPLMRVSLSGLLPVVEWLLEHGANVNVRDYWYGNALTIAVKERRNEVISRLLTTNIDVNVPTELHNQEGYTPLMYAAQAGLTSIVAELLNSGANVQIHNARGQTVFDLVAYHPEVAALLSNLSGKQASIQTNDALQSKPRVPHPPLHQAVLKNDLTQLQELLSTGNEVDTPNERGDTALHFAARRGQKEMVQLLLAAGANVGAENSVGETPWALAAINRSTDVGQVLNNAGAKIDVDKMAEHMGRRMDANDALKHSDVARVKEMIEKKEIDIDALTMGDATALITAATLDDKPMTRMLLALGADVNASNTEGKNALFFARASGNEDLASILTAAGATWPEQYIVTCAGCGRQSQVFYQPDGEPIYCNQCYQ